MVRILLLCLFVAAFGPAHAAERLTLSSGMREPWTNAEQTGFTNLLLAEMFRSAGIDGQVVFNPAAARALALANDGTDDGLAARIAGLELEYPNLVRVPEPIFFNDFVAASAADAPVTIRGWGDLSTFSVAYILGWQVFANNVPQVRDLALPKDSAQLLTLVRAGRADVILHERWQVLWHARQLEIPLRIHEPPLASVPMYLYLHKRHAGLVEPFDRALKAMKADGRHARLRDRILGPLAEERRRK
jgi:polar amino acid transport system substrate-binding protein